MDHGFGAFLQLLVNEIHKGIVDNVLLEKKKKLKRNMIVAVMDLKGCYVEGRIGLHSQVSDGTTGRMARSQYGLSIN